MTKTDQNIVLKRGKTGNPNSHYLNPISILPLQDPQLTSTHRGGGEERCQYPSPTVR